MLSLARAFSWLQEIAGKDRSLFYHWQRGQTPRLCLCTKSWVWRAVWGETFTHGSVRGWGWSSLALLDLWPPNDSSHPPHCRLHRSGHLTKNPQSRCTDSRTMCTEVPELCRLPDPQNGKIALSHEIFLQKEWFSQILCLSLPCHWWFCLTWFAALR